jgi:AraC-like DNA-binding protein
MREINHFLAAVNKDFDIPIEESNICNSLIRQLDNDKNYQSNILLISKLFQTITPFIDDDWAWVYGRELKSHNFGIAGPAILLADSLQESLDLFIEFSPLFSPVYLSQKADGDLLYFNIEFPTFFSSNLNFHLNLIISGISHFLKNHFSIDFEKINISLPSEYKNIHLSTESEALSIDYESDVFCFVFDVPTLATKNITSDKESKDHLLKLCRELNHPDLKRESYLDRVCQHVAKNLERVESFESIADILNTSTRNLRTHLAKQNTSYREIVFQHRMQKAAFLLRETKLDVESISFKTGYSNAANFRRAFKNEFNKTPSEFRKSKDLIT